MNASRASLAAATLLFTCFATTAHASPHVPDRADWSERLDELPEPPPSLPAPPGAAERLASEDPSWDPSSDPEIDIDGIHRHGFTIQLSLGAGMVSVIGEGGDDYQRGGLGGLNLMLGGFLTEDVALVAKIAGVNWGPFDPDVDEGIAAGAAPAVQVWLGDHVNIVAGAGLGVLSVGDADQPGEIGFAGMVGLNILAVALERHGFGLSLDFVPVITGEHTALTFQGGLAWQYY
ncbi:MAG: hypothetical protein RIF41_27075 [Polyangiaceae bacterium]